MSGKVIHIYRVDMGHVNDIQNTHWVYARNATVALAVCKKMFKDMRYDYYKAVMVGETTFPAADGESLSKEEISVIETTHAKDGDRYAERRVGV